MSKQKQYTEVAFEVLSEMGGGPVRSGELAKAVFASGKVEESTTSYQYILLGCKADPRFDTSTRGRIGLATVEIQETDFMSPAENLTAGE